MYWTDCSRSLGRAALLAIAIPAVACGGCDEGSEISADTIIIDETIREARTLENIIEDPEVADYLVTKANLAVSAKLTVEPGVRIAFESGTSFEFQTGALVAVGTEEEPIVFTAANGQPGGWKGIFIKSNDVENELTWVILELAGQDEQPGINEAVNLGIGNDARIKITNTTIRDSLAYGMSTRADTDLSGFENNVLTGNGTAPASLEMNSVGYLDEGSSFAGNEGDFVEVTSTKLVDDATWASIGVPYRLVEERNVVEAAWTLDPGVTVEMSSNAYIEVVQGSINAVGAADAPITFTGVAKQPGAWRVLSVGTNDTANEFTNCVFEYGGSETIAGLDEAATLGVKQDAAVTVTDSVFRGGAGWGIWADADASVTESGNTFESNALGDTGVGE